MTCEERSQPSRGIKVEAAGPVAGAEVQGDARCLDAMAQDWILRAWLDHLVLRFRNQQLTETHFLQLGRCFGPLHRAAVPVVSEGGSVAHW